MTEYLLESRTHVDKIFKKLAKKSPRQMEVFAEKIDDILADPHRFKPLHFPLAGMHRVHFGNFVLLYSIDEMRKTVVVEDYEHHDRVYG
ncbi:MAG: type II toxin-antitoxin system RelE/ParE family toxin [Nitrososphaerales archaeon]|jgi:mRNA-degrading endonuclease RelE of RelBE toxin-antitoxin system